MNRNTLLIICIVVLFAYHFYLEYDADKHAQETFDNAKVEFFSNIHDIYYINLEHRNDRNDEFLSNFSPTDQNRIHRVDGVYEKENGALGCLQSHIKALEMAVEMGSKEDEGDHNILICEDDFYIKDIFYCNRMLEFAFRTLPHWDVIMLAHNTHDSKETPYVTEKGEKIIKIVHSATGSGYLIKKSYIEPLLEIFKKDYDNYNNTNKWIPEYCNDVSWVSLQRKDEWYAFVPTVALQRSSYSDIQKGLVDYGV
jgi:GR25 family glycosyltransferase involved in LPS biosynthesis